MPIQLAAVAAAQGGMQMLGSIFGGYANAANAERSAKVADFNAKKFLENAGRIRLESGLNEEAHRRAAKRVLGEQRAAMFESGVQFSGSSADVYGQSELDAELDALNIRYEGDQQARAQEMDAYSAMSEAAALRVSAKQYRRAAWIGAGTAALQTGAQLYSAKQNESYRAQQTEMMREQVKMMRRAGGIDL